MPLAPRHAIAVAAGVLVVALAIGLYVVRDRIRVGPGTPAHDTASAASLLGALERGEVTIDSHRQRLLGVRLAMATREPQTSAIRTTGIVRYDETRLADVNLKLEGWIRDLYVNYTGQLIQRGQPLFTLQQQGLVEIASGARPNAKTSISASGVAAAMAAIDVSGSSGGRQMRLAPCAANHCAVASL